MCALFKVCSIASNHRHAHRKATEAGRYIHIAANDCRYDNCIEKSCDRITQIQSIQHLRTIFVVAGQTFPNIETKDTKADAGQTKDHIDAQQFIKNIIDRICHVAINCAGHVQNTAKDIENATGDQSKLCQEVKPLHRQLRLGQVAALLVHIRLLESRILIHRLLVNGLLILGLLILGLLESRILVHRLLILGLRLSLLRSCTAILAESSAIFQLCTTIVT